MSTDDQDYPLPERFREKKGNLMVNVAEVSLTRQVSDSNV